MRGKADAIVLDRLDLKNLETLRRLRGEPLPPLG
jgi:hypothetical protein